MKTSKENLTPSSYLETAAAIAREAGALLLTFTAETKQTRKKGAVNLVTAADVASQELIVSRLNAAFPDHAILAEEDASGVRPDPGSGAEYLWIVDPLDGTTNFSHGYPVFGVSIALAVAGRITVGVVFNPVSGELFAAERGRGATLNGQTIHVTETADVNDALLVTGVPYWIREKPERIMAKFKAFSVRAQGVRRSGAASLDMCEVAGGRADGFWEEGLAPWDTAAGSIIIAEAGGRLTNLSGGDFDIYEPEVLASNGLIHMEMLEIIRHARHERL
jgi:myo-inositol-1(or 4)-monophosphatase